MWITSYKPIILGKNNNKKNKESRELMVKTDVILRGSREAQIHSI